MSKTTKMEFIIQIHDVNFQSILNYYIFYELYLKCIVFVVKLVLEEKFN